MRKSLVIALTQFRITMRSKATLATMFLMPLSLILIFGLLLGGSSSNGNGKVYPVAVIDEDRSLASTLLLEALGREPALKVRTAEGPELNKLIADQRVAAGLAIPSGFGEAVAAGQPVSVELITHPATNQAWAIRSTVHRAVARLAADLRLTLHATASGAEGASRQALDQTDEGAVRQALDQIAAVRASRGIAVAVEAATRQAEAAGAVPQSGLDRAVLGFTVMSVMMAILLMAGVILYEQQRGTWGRLLVSPTPRASLLAGYLLAFLVTGLFQFAVLVFGTRLLFRIEWEPLLPLFAVGAATVIAAAGIGLFIAALVRTYEQQQALGVVFVIATSMLGGLFWPLELMSPTMQRIGHLTPQAWAMAGLTEVVLRGGSWTGLAWPLTVLAGMALLFAAAGLIRIQHR